MMKNQLLYRIEISWIDPTKSALKDEEVKMGLLELMITYAN